MTPDAIAGVIGRLDALEAQSDPLLQRMMRHPLQTIRCKVMGRLSQVMWKLGRERTVQVRNIYGRRMYVPLAACWDLAAFGTYYDEPEQRLLRYMLQVLKPGDDMIDAGANVGFFSGLAAELVGPRGRVAAFEPDRTALAYLRRNVSGQPQLAIVEAALSDADGEITLFRGDGNAMVSSTTVASHLEDRSDGHEMKQDTVCAMQLDSYCKETGFAPRLVKIDVEGAELSVLQGADAVLRETGPDVVLEVSFEDMETVAKPCTDFLDQRGYGMFAIRADGGLKPITLQDLRGRAETLCRETGYYHNLDNVVFQRRPDAERGNAAGI